MSKLLDRMMNLVGFEEEEEDVFEQEQKNEESVKTRFIPNGAPKKNANKVVNIHTPGQFKVVILQPENFDQARSICDHLKNKKPVIVNVAEIEKEIAQRIVDFLSGAVYSLNGNIQRVSSGIFLIAPNNVDILGDFKDVDNKSSFQWMK